MITEQVSRQLEPTEEDNNMSTQFLNNLSDNMQATNQVLPQMSQAMVDMQAQLNQLQQQLQQANMATQQYQNYNANNNANYNNRSNRGGRRNNRNPTSNNRNQGYFNNRNNVGAQVGNNPQHPHFFQPQQTSYMPQQQMQAMNPQNFTPNQNFFNQSYQASNSQPFYANQNAFHRGGFNQGNRQRSNHSYCWTHGACGHHSNQCNAPSQGHMWNATFQNKMNGNTRRCA